jgi:hypothetical protein
MRDHRPARATTIVAAVALAALLVATSTACSREPSAVNRPLVRSTTQQSVSLGFEDVADPKKDWGPVRDRLDQAHVNAVSLAVGRAEWVAFDWAAHPDSVADPGQDHLARAIGETARTPDGEPRLVDLLIDALIPNWIERDPSVAGVDTDGSFAKYASSATALHDGPVGDRFIELLEEVARRYEPDQITFTELKFNGQTFGADDAALYRKMTGARDWPRKADGSIDEQAPEIGAWRSQVIADFLDRAATALDKVAAKTGKRPNLAMDSLINWDDPAAGRPDAGLDYSMITQHADRLVLWAYLGLDERTPADVKRVTAALAQSGLPADKLTISVGLWDEGPAAGSAVSGNNQAAISPQDMAGGVRDAGTNGITAVNVTPYTLMTPEHWTALNKVWTQLPPTGRPSSRPAASP